MSAEPTRKWAIHPFLIGLYPVLFLYARNIHILPFSQVLFPAAVTLGATLVLLVAGGLLLKNFRKAGILVSLFLLLFFSYGYVYEALGGLDADRALFRHRLLLPAWAVILAGGGYLVLRARESVLPLTRILNLAGFFLVATQLVGMVFFEAGKNAAPPEEDASSLAGLRSPVEQSPAAHTYPDIYYIILDEYAGASTLRNLYGYDNRDFLSYLQGKGFHVVRDARSNYANTFLSLASSLNMQHLQQLSERLGVDAKDRAPAYDMIKNNRAVRFLKARGYRYVHFGSGWSATERNALADVNFQYGIDFQFGVGNELLYVLVSTSLLQPFAESLRRDPRNRIIGTFAKLADLEDTKGPKFVFAHILLPHPPYLFGPHGEPLPDTDAETNGAVIDDKARYLDHVKFANAKIRELLDKLLSQGRTPPVIVVQSDHGPSSTFKRSLLEDPDEITDAMLHERMTILNAYFLPPAGREPLHDAITPVNTFCFIFNVYFDANCSYQPDESYYSNYDYPFRFLNVTRRIRQYSTP